jgi:hypothetical protein
VATARLKTCSEKRVCPTITAGIIKTSLKNGLLILVAVGVAVIMLANLGSSPPSLVPPRGKFLGFKNDSTGTTRAAFVFANDNPFPIVCGVFGPVAKDGNDWPHYTPRFGGVYTIPTQGSTEILVPSPGGPLWRVSLGYERGRTSFENLQFRTHYRMWKWRLIRNPPLPKGTDDLPFLTIVVTNSLPGL